MMGVTVAVKPSTLIGRGAQPPDSQKSVEPDTSYSDKNHHFVRQRSDNIHTMAILYVAITFIGKGAHRTELFWSQQKILK